MASLFNVSGVKKCCSLFVKTMILLCSDGEFQLKHLDWF